MSGASYALAPTVPTHTGESQPEGAVFFTAPVEKIGELESAFTSAIGGGDRSSSSGRLWGVICGLTVGLLITWFGPDWEAWKIFLVCGILGWFIGRFFDRESHDKLSYIGSAGVMFVKRDGELPDPPQVVLFDRVQDVRYYVENITTSPHLRCDLVEHEGRSLVGRDFEDFLGSVPTPGLTKAIIDSLAERNIQIAQRQLQETGEARFPLFKSVDADVGEKIGEIRVTRKGLSWTENSNDTLDAPWRTIKIFAEINGDLILKADAGDRTAKMFDVANILSLTRLVSELRQGA